MSDKKGSFESRTEARIERLKENMMLRGRDQIDAAVSLLRATKAPSK